MDGEDTPITRRELDLYKLGHQEFHEGAREFLVVQFAEYKQDIKELRKLLYGFVAGVLVLIGGVATNLILLLQAHK